MLSCKGFRLRNIVKSTKKDTVKKLAFLPIWTVLILLLVAAQVANLAASAPSQPKYELRTVVLDAGHGGKDPGAHGAHSKEKDITLGIVLKVGKYIEENFPDVKVIYTRKTDVFIPLNERAAIANRANADLFISIHVNAATNPSACGTEVWVMGQHKTEANLEVAKRENSVILLEEDYKKNYEYDPNNPLSHIVFTLFQNAYMEESVAFANDIHLQFRDRAMRHSRGVKQAGFVVLYKTSMPSVLVESGFITNPEEEDFLTSDFGQDLLASGVFRAFRSYKEKLETDYLKLGHGRPVVAQQSSTKSTEIVTKGGDAEKQRATQTGQIEEPRLEFRIQILASSKARDLAAPPFSSLSPVYIEETAGGVYRFFYGHFSKSTEARAALIKAQNAGFDDAFMVAYKNGQRIDIPDALVTSDE